MVVLGRGCGLVVSVLAIYSDGPSLNTAEDDSFFCKLLFAKNRPVGPLKTIVLLVMSLLGRSVTANTRRPRFKLCRPIEYFWAFLTVIQERQWTVNIKKSAKVTGICFLDVLVPLLFKEKGWQFSFFLSLCDSLHISCNTN